MSAEVVVPNMEDPDRFHVPKKRYATVDCLSDFIISSLSWHSYEGLSDLQRYVMDALTLIKVFHYQAIDSETYDFSKRTYVYMICEGRRDDYERVFHNESDMHMQPKKDVMFRHRIILSKGVACYTDVSPDYPSLSHITMYTSYLELLLCWCSSHSSCFHDLRTRWVDEVSQGFRGLPHRG